MSEYIDPLTIGRWEDAKFVFDQPIDITDALGNKRTVRVLDTSNMTIPDDTTRDDVIHAIVNSFSPGRAAGD